jgi:tRNA threonylcarbamoyladenosine biosynthesis protein TsaB
MRWLNLGLADGDKPLGEEAFNSDRRQSETLPGAVGCFLSKHGLALRDLGLIAVTVGPGYYTGIRVGLAYASALAESLGIKTAPVSTLRVLAWNFALSGFIAAPVLRARSDSVYFAMYRGEDEIVPPTFCSASEFITKITEMTPEAPVIVGDDALRFDGIRDSGLRIIPSPPTVGLSLAAAAQRAVPVDPASLTAIYLRPPN